jgi:hypothetical protein
MNPEFATKIKAWVAYEIKQQELKAQMNKLSEAKEDLTKELINFIKINKMERTAINVGGNRLCYYDDAQYNNLTFGFLKECLTLYFGGDENKANQICDFIKTKRSRNHKSSLKLLPRKKQ